MKILYGVQGTGNGHLTRARSMAKAFAKLDVKVDWVFSGRNREDFFDMQPFGDFRCYRGMTLQTKKGKVNMPKTILKSNLRQLRQDVRALNASDYDLVVSDFEPVTAWAARMHGVRSIGVSHQCAFLYPIPKKASNFITDIFMRWFAPIDTPVGVHWHHFDQSLLPPIVEPSEHPNTAQKGKILVYLPFADVDDFLPLLAPFKDHEFYVYHKFKQTEDRGHIHLRPFSREGFQQDLHSAEGVMCSAGFELPSEAITLGKKLLVEPVRSQMEQQSNALALQALGYATTTDKISEQVIRHWLTLPKPAPLHYPDVAQAIARWMVKDGAKNLPQLSNALWQQVAISPLTTPDLNQRLKQA
ncbi:glycosyl transferase [Gilvimarinus agarilyticus]|uniref:MJ1255/VC2487 family glycosyltransferase n=1 Tax=unclassified Gilvimarinus TaxID=2642066 RepID=UPI001C098140|nr:MULTISPECIES: MJ1255/VC2487 family glycosyltransferase [unclassified Gilvimarinus]MBU2884693.1 glycosyl transferase [Gilvimarinus agarilyticus]MDO6569801.1 glycosyltransferase family protein [Gilvimarinus sp. 2_MG-2023]MDO6747385.1 glycosyltransferase family protein [Gilvimarinus sp. 1_MG-2023]